MPETADAGGVPRGLGDSDQTVGAGDPVRVLLASNRWAMHALLDAMEPLTDAQLDEAFEMGLGTLRSSVRHMLGAMDGWTGVLLGEPFGGGSRPPALTPERSYSVAEFRRLTDEIADALERAAAGDMDKVFTGERGGRRYSFTRGGVVCHVATHGFHHRAQCLNMLRRLGVGELPRSSVYEWMLHEPGAVLSA